MGQTLGILLAVCGLGGIIAGGIAYSKTEQTSSFVAFFFIGLFLPLLGIIFACLVKSPPKPPGWYRDPWNQQFIRWYDGRDWTPATQPVPGK